MKIAELTGYLLDLWTARADGVDAVLSDEYPDGSRAAVVCHSRDHNGFLDGRSYCPSKQWGDGGPLMDKFHFWISDDDTGIVYASITPHVNDAIQEGKTVLEAMCRALIFSVYGKTVPDEPACTKAAA